MATIGVVRVAGDCRGGTDGQFLSMATGSFLALHLAACAARRYQPSSHGGTGPKRAMRKSISTRTRDGCVRLGR